MNSNLLVAQSDWQVKSKLVFGFLWVQTKELKQRPYQRDCFFVPQVEMVYGTRRISNGMHQYCDRFLHQETWISERTELFNAIAWTMFHHVRVSWLIRNYLTI